jgi:hypothetical protein
VQKDFLIYELESPTTLRLVRLTSTPATLAVVAVFVILGATGCGSSVVKVSAGSLPARNRTFQGPNSAQFQKFLSCMKAHGVSDFGRFGNPNGQSPGTGRPYSRPTFTPAQRQTLQKALAACRSLLPSSGFGPGRFGGPNPGRAPSAPSGSL